MIKKFLGTVVVGIVVASFAKEGYSYVKDVKNSKKLIDETEKILDPFVRAYAETNDENAAFQKIISEKLTIGEVKKLRAILRNRYSRLSILDGSYEYSKLIDTIEELLPVEGSIQDTEWKCTEDEW